MLLCIIYSINKYNECVNNSYNTNTHCLKKKFFSLSSTCTYELFALAINNEDEKVFCLSLCEGKLPFMKRINPFYTFFNPITCSIRSFND